MKPIKPGCALAISAPKLQGEQGKVRVPLKQPHLQKARGRGGKKHEGGRQETVQFVIV